MVASYTIFRDMLTIMRYDERVINPISKTGTLFYLTSKHIHAIGYCPIIICKVTLK